MVTRLQSGKVNVLFYLQLHHFASLVSAIGAAGCFFALDAAQFTFRNVPAFAANYSHGAGFGDGSPKTAQ
jgi:hypothetical protein